MQHRIKKYREQNNNVNEGIINDEEEKGKDEEEKYTSDDKKASCEKIINGCKECDNNKK